MDGTTIRNDLRHFIIDELGWNGSPEQLTDDLPLIDNQVIDSLGIFQIVTLIQEQYGVEIADEDLLPANFENLNTLAQLVMAKEPSTP